MSADRFCDATGIDRSEVEALGEISTADLAKFADLYERARDAREKDLNTAIDGGLGVLPRLLRPVVRKVLFS
ncbi:hypothetical protein [Antrihabitans stalactiti]|uniref:Uncharacterized protein n=1 Tax=Antrihabitans stalactiti TaxID=2584121 RepID=A0A848KAU1_9NOCA|nr:hypothetical protein [Antrihabitans stalactiti]NMN94806.1 hypothetical protein [Antrihabitans stalactiti]